MDNPALNLAVQLIPGRQTNTICHGGDSDTVAILMNGVINATASNVSVFMYQTGDGR
jgi:hypothetical protein